MKRKSFSLLFLDIMNWTCLIYPLFFPSVAASASLMSEPLLFFVKKRLADFLTLSMIFSILNICYFIIKTGGFKELSNNSTQNCPEIRTNYGLLSDPIKTKRRRNLYNRENVKNDWTFSLILSINIRTKST